MKTLLHILLAAVVVVGLLLTGRYTAGWWAAAEKPAHDHAAMTEGEDQTPLGWTCPMHPQIKLPDQGKCPNCGMDLTPIKRGEQLGPREFAMSQAARKLAGIETAPVTRQFLTKPIRMVGKVDYDETKIRTIAARVPGRIDRMYVDYTGVRVKKGDHLVWLYSPTLLTAQQELLESKKRLEATAREASAFLRDSNKKAYASARDKLLLWGLTKAQVDAIERRGSAEDHMMIRSPTGGVVIHKLLEQGDYVKEGSKVYRIADLDKLWLRLDAYEQDLPWLRFGQQVTVQAEALPGEVFSGWISFIDPVLHEHTRSVKVRVNIANADGRLKPGMFVRAVVRSRIADTNRVIANRLADKWISPMHPEIVKDAPGKCDVCGMDLVKASDLGYVSAEATEKPVVVPATAVLVTGTRAVVYVELPGKKRPTFEGREVILGPRAGDHYIVRFGLREHERVVVNGAFRIDSSMQIRAKPSMLSMPSESKLFTGPDTAVFRASLGAVYESYFALQEALAADDLALSKTATAGFSSSIDAVLDAGMPADADEIWQEESRVLAATITKAKAAASLADLRSRFDALSRSVLRLERSFRHPGSATHLDAFCPMAFDNRGAAWLQRAEKITNPYFGAQMLHCGEVRDRFFGVAATGREKQQVPDERIPAERPPTTAPRKREPEQRKPEQPKPEQPKPQPPAAFDLGPLYVRYFELQSALAADDPAAAGAAIERLSASLAKRDRKSLQEDIQAAWQGLSQAVTRAAKAAEIGALRVEFETISNAMIQIQAATGHRGADAIHRAHCPMAFDGKGADWLQVGKVIRNPYYGAAMLRCGSVKQTIDAKSGK